MNVTSHVIKRLEERFSRVVDEMGIENMIETIDHVVKYGQPELIRLTSDRFMFYINFKVYKNETRYNTYKIAFVATKDFKTLITVLTDKMVREMSEKHQNENVSRKPYYKGGVKNYK